MNTSLLYEIVLYLNSYYFGFFGICESAMFLIKLLTLPLPEGSLITEVLILGFLLILEGARIFLGRKGNLTENSTYMLISTVLKVKIVLFCYNLCNRFFLRFSCFSLDFINHSFCDRSTVFLFMANVHFENGVDFM